MCCDEFHGLRFSVEAISPEVSFPTAFAAFLKSWASDAH